MNGRLVGKTRSLGVGLCGWFALKFPFGGLSRFFFNRWNGRTASSMLLLLIDAAFSLPSISTMYYSLTYLLTTFRPRTLSQKLVSTDAGVAKTRI